VTRLLLPQRPGPQRGHRVERVEHDRVRRADVVERKRDIGDAATDGGEPATDEYREET